MQVEDNQLLLSPDVLPYDLATPLFSDYALKLRTVWIPEGRSARYTETDSFDFPVGSILSKTFYYPRTADGNLLLTEEDPGLEAGGKLDLDRVRLLETRLLVHQEQGWRALPYIWNEAQDEAVLQITGAIERITAKDALGQQEQFPYIVPNRNECAGCHALNEASGQMQAIGPSARNLNKTYTHYPDGAAPQLQTWEARGFLQGLPESSQIPHDPLWEAGAGDQLEHRARAWLDVNCGHCHRPGGAGATSGLYLHRAETSMVRLGQCKPPIAAGRGTGGNRYSIVPGDPDASILAYRIASRDPGILMPELGRTLVHESGLTLVRDWIAGLPGEC